MISPTTSNAAAMAEDTPETLVIVAKY
jgi:hypothetical protein